MWTKHLNNCFNRFSYATTAHWSQSAQHNYVWGIDLERVVNLHGIKRGDRISLKCVGKQPVEIEIDEIQPDQSVITVKKWVERNTWVAKVHQRAPEPPQDK